MEDRPPIRSPIVVAALLLFVGFISNGLALSTSVLVDAGQAPYERKVDKTVLLSANGCPPLGCTDLPHIGQPDTTSAPPKQDETTTKTSASAVANSTALPSQAPASAQPQAGTTINKPTKKSHPNDAALVPFLRVDDTIKPASQYHYYGGGTEERRTRNVRMYPTPMKRKYAGYSRLKRSVRLSPKEVLALLSLWERPLARGDVDDELNSGSNIPTESSRRRYFKQEDVDPEMLLDEDVDDDVEYGVERGRESWGNVVRPASRRFTLDDFYRNDLRDTRKRNWPHQQRLPQRYVAVDEQLEAKKRFDRLVQEQLNQLRQLLREEQEDQRGRLDSLTANDRDSFASTDWAPQAYKRRTSFGAARNKPEENKYHPWLQGQ